MSRSANLFLASIALIGVGVALFFLAGDWVSKRELTAMEMRIARRAVEDYSSRHGRLPGTIQDALEPIGKSRIVDRWGDSFRYVLIDEDHALLISMRSGRQEPFDALILECARQKSAVPENS